MVGANCKIVCNYHTERRAYSQKDAARIICYAVANGASLKGIISEASDRCGPFEEADCDCEKLREIIRRYEVITATLLALLGVGIGSHVALRTVLARGLKVLTRAEKKVLTKSRETEKLLTDGKTVIEGEFRVLKEEFLPAKPIIIKP